MEAGQAATLEVFPVHSDGAAFFIGPAPTAPAFTVAVAAGVLDEAASQLAFACDVLVVDPAASLVVGDLALLRQRAGVALDKAAEGDRIGATALLALGLALFAIDGSLDETIGRILGLADTLSALVRARRFAVPRWSAPDAGVDIEVEGRVATIRLVNQGVPCFTIALLEAMDAFFARWREGQVAADTLLFASATPSTFSMGGDLATITALARARDETALRYYAHLSVRVVHALWTGLGREVLTVGATDGKAFGSGFEAIAACQFAVAGAGATFAFPEARFGLFPGMGATSLLGRRAAPALAEALIVSRRQLDALQALELGAIDAIAGPEGAEAYARHVVLQGAERQRQAAVVRRRRHPYTLEEAIAVVDVWVDAVLDLSARRLDEIERISRMQRQRSANKKESFER